MADAAYVACINAKPGDILEPTEDHITQLERNIVEGIEVMMAETSSALSRFFGVSIALPTGCNKWHAFNYLYRQCYNIHSEAFCRQPAIVVDLDTDMTPAVIKYRSMEVERDKNARQRSDAFFEEPSNFIGAVEYKNEVLLVFKGHAPEGSCERTCLKKDLGEQVKFGGWSWGGNNLWITVPKHIVPAFKEMNRATTERVAHWVEHCKDYKLKLHEKDQSAFDEFCTICYGVAENQFREPRRIPIKLSIFGVFVLETYGFSQTIFNPHTESQRLHGVCLGDAFYGKHDDIVDQAMITGSDFFEHLKTVMKNAKNADNSKKVSKRRKLLDVYEQDEFKIEHLSNGDVVHVFEDEKYMSIKQLCKKDQVRLANSIQEKINEKGVACTCQVIQKPGSLVVLYKRPRPE